MEENGSEKEGGWEKACALAPGLKVSLWCQEETGLAC